MHIPPPEDFDDDQERFFGRPLTKSCIVTGPPGTGKTVLAFHRAHQVQRLNKRATVVTFGRLLQNYLADPSGAFTLEPDTVKTWWQWFGALYKTSGQWSVPMVPLPPDQEDQRREAAKRRSRRSEREIKPDLKSWTPDWPRIDARFADHPPDAPEESVVLIDEGQDIWKEFYEYLSLFEDLTVTIFADDNQMLHEARATINEIVAYSGIDDEVRLSVNHRNSREIAELARIFYTRLRTGMPDLPPAGTHEQERPRIKGFRSQRDCLDFMAIEISNFRDLQFGVFLELQDDVYRYHQALTSRVEERGIAAARVQKYARESDKPPDLVSFGKEGGVLVTTWMSAKGLEFDTVFLPELQRSQFDMSDTTFKMKMYVLVSRAKAKLFLLWWGDDRPSNLDEFPRDLVQEDGLQ